MTFEETMKVALGIYGTGMPVVLLDTDSRIIHGHDLLGGSSPTKCFVIGHIDIEQWKISMWPQILEGAKTAWLKNHERSV